MKRVWLCVLILHVFVVFMPSCFAAIQFSKDKGTSEFMAIGNPSAIRIEGKGAGPAGELQVREEGSRLFVGGALKVDMKSYATGIALRDRHMKEKYLEVEKFQNATLNIQEISLDKAALQKNPETKAAFTATLDFHGVQRPVQGEFVLKPMGPAFSIHAQFPLKLSDFSIAVPSFAGITVADQVEISTTSEVERFLK